MPDPTIPKADWLAYGIFGTALFLVLKLHLLPALLSGLLVYALVMLLVPVLRVPSLGRDATRLLAVALIAIATIGLVTGAGFGIVAFVRTGSESLPKLAQSMAAIIEGSRDQLPPWALAYLPADAEELRLFTVEWLRTHADRFGVAGAGLGRAIAHIITGMVAGALIALETAVPKETPGTLSVSLRARARALGLAFRNVVFAQVWISAFNTLLTAIYLAVALPALGVNLPFTKTLIAITFLAGLMPILGNLVSNTAIFVVSLSQSLGLAVASLAYLVVIHKLEYFLNARIIGGHIRAKAWELLIVMILMEASFGLGGLIAAPIIYAYVKDELRALRLI
ncbi:MAG: AI-2E family transporter [Deltaproteobacteria bacterium]|nr:AI-2E family transporter [Deltaproteobacteria bacterium]